MLGAHAKKPRKFCEAFNFEGLESFIWLFC